MDTSTKSGNFGINDFPDEVLLNIFIFLNEADYSICQKVCKRWASLTSDVTLLYAIKKMKSDIRQLFLECCEDGYRLSIEYIIKILTKPMNSPHRGHHSL